MPKVIHQCDRCGAKSPATTEMNAEIWFSNHECKGMRPLKELPLPILRKLAMSEITEEEAWKEAQQ